MVPKKRNLKNRSINNYFSTALKQARKAFQKNEVPVGAVIVMHNQIIAQAHNFCRTLKDPTAHAEMQAITSACHYLGNPYLNDTMMFVTLEPCLMCAAALKHAHIDQVFYLVADNQFGYTSIAPNLIKGQHYLTSQQLKSEAQNMLIFFLKIYEDNYLLIFH